MTSSAQQPFLDSWSNNFWTTPPNLNDAVNVFAGLGGPIIAHLAPAIVVSTEAEAVQQAAEHTIEAGGAIPSIATGIATDGAAGGFRELAGAAFASAAAISATNGVAALVAAGLIAPELALGVGIVAAAAAAFVAGREIVSGIDALNQWLAQSESSGQVVNETVQTGESVTIQPSGAYTVVTSDAVYYYNSQGQLANVLIQGSTESLLFGTVLTIDNTTNTISATDFNGNPIGVQVVVDDAGNSTIVDSSTGATVGTMGGSTGNGYSITSASGEQLNVPSAASGGEPSVVQQTGGGSEVTTTINNSDGAVTAVATAADGSVVSTTTSMINESGNGYTATTTYPDGNVSVKTTSLNEDGSSTSTWESSRDMILRMAI
jgi:hypothetical protein